MIATYKKVLKIGAGIFILGMLIIGFTFSPVINKPQCEGNTQVHVNTSDCIVGANIGAGMFYLLGLGLAVIGGLGTIFSGLLLFSTKFTNPKLVFILGTLMVLSLLLIWWYVDIHLPKASYEAYKAEIKSREISFVEYNGAPHASTVSNKSTAIETSPISENPSSLSLNLYDCSPGSAEVAYVTGSTHFIFSGIKNKSCVFYYGEEVENSNWNGLLNIQCESPILDSVAASTKKFQITSQGVDFGQFKINYCKDIVLNRGFGF